MKYSSITISTIRDFIERRYEVWAFCGDLKCNHSAQLDLYNLAEKFGLDFEPMAQAINPRLRCSKCGKKERIYSDFFL